MQADEINPQALAAVKHQERGPAPAQPPRRESPPATVVTAGFDPLRDGGRAHADKLEADGVSVRYRSYEAKVHGFLTLRGVNRAWESIDEVGGNLEEAFGKGQGSGQSYSLPSG